MCFGSDPGLESSLETLAASVAELQAALANAATADEVAALATALAAQQVDLDELLAQNNIYAPTGSILTVSSQSELDFALALGDKVSIINGGVHITHTSTMNDADVASLMAKMVSVTGTVTYTATASSTTQGVFTQLNGAKNVTINQSGDISLPALKSTGALSLSGDDFTTSVSLPALTHATSGLGSLSFAKATSVDLSALTAYDSAISITTADNASVNLSAFTNLTKVDGTAATTFESLTIVNASTLIAPVFAKGDIVADALTSVDLPKWESLSASSSFAKADTVVLPSVNPGKAAGATIAIDTVFDRATSVHIVAAASTKTSVTTAQHLNVTSSSSRLETLILGGTFSNVTISSGSDLTSLTFDGTALNVKVAGTDLSTLDIPYTSAAKGSLEVSGNSDLTSLTADNVDGLHKLIVKNNSELDTISFAALNDVGAATAAVVDIQSNDLTIESIQLPGTSPVVAHVITSADFEPLSDFIADAAGQIGTAGSVVVKADNIGKTITAAGVEDLTVAATDLIYDTDSVSGADTAAGVIANVDYEASNAVGGVSQVREMLITGLDGTDSNNGIQVGDDIVSIIPSTGLSLYYDVANWAADAGTAAQLSSVGVAIDGYGKGVNTASIEFKGLTNVSGVYVLDAGDGAAVSVTSGSASSIAEIATAFKTALDAGTGVASKYYSVATGTGTGLSKLDFTSLAKGSQKSVFTFDLDVYALSGSVASTTSLGFNSASIVLGDNTGDVGSAYVTFKSTAAGVAGAKTVTFTNGTATILTASGINTGAGNLVGDDEKWVDAKDGTGQTNADSIARKSVNFSSKLAS
ncbi:hypothetical protein MCN98_07975 [Flavobacteriaceae bacterium LSUCC0859]|nr:hypothetical protein [Flavobacteriaceae bacterium LSUCC0859]